jgi:tRNA A64-2'-O-ribosylphosphate transferase
MRTYDLMNTAFLLLTSRGTEQDDVLPAFSSQTIMLQVHIIEGKNGHIHFLKEVLPHSIEYIRRQLLCGKRVCVACSTGQDISVGVALCALQQFFDDEGNYVATELDRIRKRSRYRSSNLLITTLS